MGHSRRLDVAGMLPLVSHLKFDRALFNGMKGSCHLELSALY